MALLDKTGIDLRDPKLSITQDGHIMVILGGSVYDGEKLLARRPQVSFSDQSGRSFSSPEQVDVRQEDGKEDSWIWRVIWNKETGYGTRVQIKSLDLWSVYIDKTTDGKKFEVVSN